MLNDVTIERAKPEDVRELAVFMKGFEKESEFIEIDVDHGSKVFENMVSTGYLTILIMKKNGQIIGGLGFGIYPDIYNGKKTAIETFWYVHPDHRGTGILLFNEFEKIASEKGCKKLVMIHLADSYAKMLERLYLKKGYKLAEKFYVKEIGK